MKVELHLIQNYPPSNPNRDQNNAPKDCDFGGHRRGRISSQSLKRAARKWPHFETYIKGKIADRSRRVATEIAECLHTKGKSHDIDVLEEAAAALLRQIFKASTVDSKHKMQYAYYISPAEIDTLAGYVKERVGEFADLTKKLREAEAELDRVKKSNKAADEESKDKKAEKAAQKEKEEAKKAVNALFKKESAQFTKDNKNFARTIDLALFGRMLADATDLNIDAASQVAHAVSTNRLRAEFDFYTAVDDFQPNEEPGAGMMGTLGFNSSCHYRYALIDVNQLALNLTEPPENKKEDKKTTRATREAACDGLEAFLRASVFSVPSGKINSHAQNVQPQFIMAVVRDEKGCPCSLVNAFAKPARPRDGQRDVSLVEDSIAKLVRHWKAHVKMFGKHHKQASFIVGDDLGLRDALRVNNADTNFPKEYDLVEKESLDVLIESIRTDLNDWLENGAKA